MVKDPVEHSLKSEKKLIDMVRSKLKSACEDSWQQLAVLEQIKQNLELDLEDKTEALNIDMDQLRLSERSAGLTRKPNAIRNPKR